MDPGVVERLASFPSRLEAAARACAAAEGESGVPAGEWTAREVVAHLVAVEREVWCRRLDELSAGPEEPSWQWTEPGPVPEPAARTLAGSLGLFGEARAGTLARVEALDGAGWARTGVHATYGRLDVAGLLWVAVRHDEEHLAGLEARVRAGA